MYNIIFSELNHFVFSSIHNTFDEKQMHFKKQMHFNNTKAFEMALLANARTSTPPSYGKILYESLSLTDFFNVLI